MARVASSHCRVYTDTPRRRSAQYCTQGAVTNRRDDDDGAAAAACVGQTLYMPIFFASAALYSWIVPSYLFRTAVAGGM